MDVAVTIPDAPSGETVESAHADIVTAAAPTEPPAETPLRPKSPLPRFDEVGDEFFEELYLALNPDVAAAVTAGLPSGYEHWRTYGADETEHHAQLRSSIVFGPMRAAHTMTRADAEQGFDPLSYLYLHPDVLSVTQGDSDAARGHWLDHGRFEGRMAPGVRRAPLRHVDLEQLSARPLGFNVFGLFGAPSGMGTASRAFAKAVKATGLPFELHVFGTGEGGFCVPEPLAKPVPTYRINLIIANADQIARVMLAYPPGYFDDAYNIAVWNWELASPRADTFYAFDGLDEVWATSTFVMDAVRAVAPIPTIKINIPVVPTRLPTGSAREAYGIPADRFVFILPFDVRSTSARKNPLAVVRAFQAIAQEFPSSHLILKYHGGRHENLFVQELLAAVVGVANMTVISSEMTLAQLDTLRMSCDCLVSPHRSEGFGLNIAEFMSLGKPVIATNYSGNLDFFDETVGFPIDYKLVELTKFAGPYQPGFQWADPLDASIAAQMRLVLSDPAEANSRGEAAATRIKSLLSLDTISEVIKRRLEALEFDRAIPAFAKRSSRGDVMARRTLIGSAASSDVRTHHGERHPFLSVVVPVFNVPAQYLKECIGSVLNQTYPYWELCICDDCSTAPDTIALLDELRGSSPMIKVVRNVTNQGIAGATNKALEMATGEFIVLLDNDDRLLPDALQQVVEALAIAPDSDVLYSDEEKIDADGNKIDHFYKPDWSPEHLESVMYVLHMFVIRKRLLLELGGLRAEYDGSQDYDLMLRCSRATTRIHHIAKVIYQWRAIPGSAAAVVDAKPTALENGKRALQDHATIKYGPLARVEAGLLTGTFRLRRPLPYPPKTTLLILTGNARLELPGRGEVSLVENMVASIRDNTDYPNYEIMIVDNSTLAPAQVKMFEAGGAKVLNFEWAGPFNYAAKANFAMRSAPTDYIVLMNDDMEVIRPDWLTSLMELTTDPAIGAVGARLLHMDGTIQHVGCVLGVNRGSAHIYHSYPRDFVGYNAFTHVIRNYSVVTAACLATRRSIASQVGWMDEQLAIDFNDIDFCLRIRAAGYRVAYTPYAELYHFEGVSAKRTVQNPAEVRLFCERWSTLLENDPYYNVNLTRNSLDFAERTL